jgi:urease accessory protein
VDRARAALLPLTVDSRELRHIGRRARLELAFERRRGRTVLTRSFAEPPLRVGRCLDDGDGIHLILAMSAPGIFGGDWFDQTIHVGDGARLRLTSQSAMQAHAAVEPDTARVHARYFVGDDAQLVCRWHPLIPFAGSRLEQRIDIQLARGAEVSWSDALLTGRVARDERWRFEALSHELRVTRLGALEYMERYDLRPAERDPSHPWAAGSASAFGTTFSSGRPVPPDTAERLYRTLSEIPGLRAAADALGERFLLARLIGEVLPSFHDGRAIAERTCFESAEAHSSR